MDYSSPFAIRLRAIGQRLGVLRPIVRLYRRVFSKSYEERFHNALMTAIRPGDTCWDVGANVGVYTSLFAEKVGPLGSVTAFEPSPRSFEIVNRLAQTHPNIKAQNLALSDKEGHAIFYVNVQDGSGATDSLSNRGASSQRVDVSVRRGDSIEDSIPNIIKIDVEGFELEVIKGLSGILGKPSLRALFVEVHFKEMNNRGLRTGANDISTILEASGFEVIWTDPSHIRATRQTLPTPTLHPSQDILAYRDHL